MAPSSSAIRSAVRAVLLHEHQLVALGQQLLGQVEADPASADDDDEHAMRLLSRPPGLDAPSAARSPVARGPGRCGVLLGRRTAHVGRARLAGSAHEAADGVDHPARPVDRVDAHRGVGLGAHRVVDLGHDVRDAERLGRQLGGEDVAVVAVGEREEPVRPFRAGAPEGGLVGAVAAQRLAREAGVEPAEGIGAVVEHRDLVAELRERAWRGRPRPVRSR